MSGFYSVACNWYYSISITVLLYVVPYDHDGNGSFSWILYAKKFCALTFCGNKNVDAPLHLDITFIIFILMTKYYAL